MRRASHSSRTDVRAALPHPPLCPPPPPPTRKQQRPQPARDAHRQRDVAHAQEDGGPARPADDDDDAGLAAGRRPAGLAGRKRPARQAGGRRPLVNRPGERGAKNVLLLPAPSLRSTMPTGREPSTTAPPPPAAGRASVALNSVAVSTQKRARALLTPLPPFSLPNACLLRSKRASRPSPNHLHSHLDDARHRPAADQPPPPPLFPPGRGRVALLRLLAGCLWPSSPSTTTTTKEAPSKP